MATSNTIYLPRGFYPFLHKVLTLRKVGHQFELLCDRELDVVLVEQSVELAAFAALEHGPDKPVPLLTGLWKTHHRSDEVDDIGVPQSLRKQCHQHAKERCTRIRASHAGTRIGTSAPRLWKHARASSRQRCTRTQT